MVYEENIEAIRGFVNSDFFKSLAKDEVRTKLLIEDGLYRDPDYYDEALYEYMAKRLKMTYKKGWLYDGECKISLDGVCGWKAIVRAHCPDGDYSNIEGAITDYETIRGRTSGHLAWPRHRCSINQLRYSKLNDRVDWTLFDIKRFYDYARDVGWEETQDAMVNTEGLLDLQRAYAQPKTFKWLQAFDTFEKMVDQMGLEGFVRKANEEKYDVLDLTKGDNSVIAAWTDDCSISCDIAYLKNLVAIVGKTGEEINPGRK